MGCNGVQGFDRKAGVVVIADKVVGMIEIAVVAVVEGERKERSVGLGHILVVASAVGRIDSVPAPGSSSCRG